MKKTSRIYFLSLRSYKLSDVVSGQRFSSQKSWIFITSPLPPKEELSPESPQVIHRPQRIHPEASSENYGSRERIKHTVPCQDSFPPAESRACPLPLLMTSVPSVACSSCHFWICIVDTFFLGVSEALKGLSAWHGPLSFPSSLS